MTEPVAHGTASEPPGSTGRTRWLLVPFDYLHEGVEESVGGEMSRGAVDESGLGHGDGGDTHSRRQPHAHLGGEAWGGVG